MSVSTHPVASVQADRSDSPTIACREGILVVPGAFRLHFGGELHDVRIGWRLVGGNGPVVAALGGISAGRIVASTPAEKGWWSDIVGPGAPLDTQSCQVLGFDFLGGSGQTTGPQRGQPDFPSVSAFDQAEVLRRLLEHLQIPQLQLIAGASYGGMVALAFAERFPDLVRHIVVISAADRAHPLSTAWRSVQRAFVRYALKHNDGTEGLRLARALAMATYRSADEFATRFGGEAVQNSDGQFQFPVESYLLARGDAYAAAYIPEAFVCLSESIDLHRVAAAKIHVPTTLVAVREDQLVPLADVCALHGKLAQSELVEISSLYGHDAFLKEANTLRTVFSRSLQSGGKS